MDRNKIPTNKKGRLKDELIEVLYYYKKKAKVIVKYIDEETGEEIALSEEINGYYGDDYQSSEKEIENYNLIKTTENPSGIMNSGEKELIYYYHKIFKVLTFVENSGGTIEGDEKVLEGYDSTINRIRIKADKNHYIARITINGEDIAITNKQSMILENFINMHEDKNIVVKFGEIVHNVPKTSKNSISLILVIIIFMSGLMIAYFACKNKRTSF